MMVSLHDVTEYDWLHKYISILNKCEYLHYRKSNFRFDKIMGNCKKEQRPWLDLCGNVNMCDPKSAPTGLPQPTTKSLQGWPNWAKFITLAPLYKIL